MRVGFFLGAYKEKRKKYLVVKIIKGGRERDGD